MLTCTTIHWKPTEPLLKLVKVFSVFANSLYTLHQSYVYKLSEVSCTLYRWYQIPVWKKWSIFSVSLSLLVHGSHLEQRNSAGTKWLGRYQVQASRFMAQVIVLVIIIAMISNDWKIGIMEESKKSRYNYCLIVKNREIL